MDTTRDIIYRGFYLNEADIAITGGNAAGSGITGCVVDSFDMSDVDVVQWSEKRSQGDGNDAGDVFMGVRRIRIAGTLYGLTRNLLFDQLWDLRAALNPVLAQREEPLDKGYRPLYFAVPTNRIADYPDEVIELQVKALPRAIQHVFHDDEQGGDDDDALALPWQATLICKDPGIYSADPVTVDFTATSNFSSTTTAVYTTDLFTTGAAHGLSVNDRITFSSITGSTGVSTGVAYYVKTVPLTTTFTLSATLGGSTLDVATSNITAATWVKSSTATHSTSVDRTWYNRGTHLGKVNLLVEVGAGAGSISAQVGDSTFTITVPASTVNRTIRVKDDHTVTFEENSVEVENPGAISFTGDSEYPLIDPGDTPYTVTFHGMSGVVNGSRMWFYEQFA